MLAKIYGFFARARSSDRAPKISGLEDYVKLTNADPWHLYAIRKRHRRPHVCLACAWLADYLDKDALIFEAGCGSGINLLWLGARGFRNLRGADLAPEAVALAALLSKHLKIDMDIWRDDSLAPRRLPAKIDGLISLNWLYHLPGASLDGFLSAYRPFLAQGAKLAFDMVDSSFNTYRNNAFHTDDARLPATKRRLSEYTLRLSAAEIAAILARHGFTTLRESAVRGPVPRTVWLAEYSGAAAPRAAS